jgi:tRNA pseudouridine38-40 synthase
MTRWALLIEYDGTGFVGWQRQDNGLSVQQLFEEAAARIAGAPVSSICAGRTDAGVHAEGQVAHIDLARDIGADSLAAALNYHLKPHPVVVRQAAVVDPEFSARFSAVGRAYRYVILNRRARPALALNRVWHLLGRYDFSSFRASSCQAKSPLRTLDRLSVLRAGETIDIIAEARSFLHHQVRNMVGTLRLVGEGKWPPARIIQTLAACDRRQAGPTAPPDGLTLTGVRYLSDPFGGDSAGNSGASSGVG